MSIVVSISCITYNHEKYVAQALEGFLDQKTEFGYEILVHDDASTDRTPEIILQYAEQYPDLIKPILQSENQYSKGLRVGTVYNFPRAQGKYVAFCEGDDFWTDPLKLQKQVYFMKSNPVYSVCFHGVEVVDKEGRSTGKVVSPYVCSQDVPVEDIILGIGEYHRTCSLLARAECMQNLPAFYFRAPAGDLALILSLAARGKVYYLDEVMASYRSGIAGSWTSQLEVSAEKQVQVRTGLLQMFAEFDEFTGYKYRETVAQRRHRTQFLIFLARGDIKALRSSEYKEYRDAISRYLLAKVYLRHNFPNAYRILRKIYNNSVDLLNNRE